MARRTMTTGKCYLCGGTFSKRAMTNHLQACRQAHPQPLSGKGKERTTKLFHLLAQGRDLPEYWLHLEIPADAKLKDLDGFLRDIWLECCGHLSAFRIGGMDYYCDRETARELEGETMGVALRQVLKPGMEFYHEYDFGTTTELTLKVVGERDGTVRGNSLQLIARNDPPPITCGVCGKPSTDVCVECIWEGEGWLCEECAEKHECGEEMLLPVVNSPRTWMCGYTG